MTSLDHLLPKPDEVVRCADHARRIAIDPGGTAIRADRVVLIETSQPWPKPVFDHPTLIELDPLFKSASRRTRLLACQPDDDPATRVWVFDRLDRWTRERRFEVQTPNELLDLSGCLVAEVGGDELTSGATQPVFDGPMTEPAVLVCTQGSHDICCGADGERFAKAVEGAARVFRVSHTGGHRFAPTAMTLPDGRMWAYLVPELMAEILAAGNGEHGDGLPAGGTAGGVTEGATVGAERLATYCRGWWGAEQGPAQMAERAVYAEVGFDLDTMARTVTEPEPGRFEVTAVDGEGVARCWTVEVELLREVPTIACRQPGGLPAKTAREYQAAVISTGTVGDDRLRRG